MIAKLNDLYIKDAVDRTLNPNFPHAGLNEAALRRTLPRARSERHGRFEPAIIR